MIGTMAVFAVQKMVISTLDLVNAISWIDLYVSTSKVKVQLYVLVHWVGYEPRP